MEKMNNNFRLLSQEESAKLKGGGWLIRSIEESGDSRREWRLEIRTVYMGSCPPPDPTERKD